MKNSNRSIQLKRRTFIAGSLASLAMLAAPKFARAAKGEAVSARMDFAPWGVQAAMFLAQSKGWFTAAGLNVDIQDGRGSGNTLQLVNAGQVDVGQVQLGLVPQARVKSAKVRAFAGFGRATDLAAIVDSNSPFRKVADLKGKRVVCFAGSPWAPFIDFWLAQGGLDRSSVELMMVDATALWSTYTTGRADAILSTGPSIIPPAQSVRPSRAILASDAGVNFPSYGLIASDQMVGERSDVLTALVKTQQQAWQYLKDGHADEGADAMIQLRPNARLNKEILVRQIQMTLETFDTPATVGKPIGWQAEQDWEAAMLTMKKANALTQDVSLADIYTNQYIV